MIQYRDLESRILEVDNELVEKMNAYRAYGPTI